MESGQLEFTSEAATDPAPTTATRFTGAELAESHVHGSVWKVRAEKGKNVRRGDVLVVLESMKMEIAIESPVDGTVLEVLAAEGQAVAPGQALFALRPETTLKGRA